MMLPGSNPRAARLFALLAVLSAMGLVGCAPYVNVPGQSGDVAQSNPNLITVKNVSIAAIDAVLTERPVRGSAGIKLPTGTKPEVLSAVAAGVGDRVTLAPGPGATVIEVRHVYVRGWHATVDITRPLDPGQSQGPLQLVSVYLKKDPFAGWIPQRVRVWRIDAEAALLQSIGEASGG